MAETTDPDARDDGETDSSAAWRRRAVMREAAHDLAGALDAYDQALKRSPDDIGLFYDLGRLALQMEMPQVAEAFYRRCIEAAPGDHAALNGLARALSDQHRYDEAVGALRLALTTAPGEAILWNTLGTLLVRRGDSALALTMFEEAVRLDPGFALAVYNRSGARMDLGRLTEALHDCEAAIALAEADDAFSTSATPADVAMMRFARATLLLCLGRLEEGWTAYAARLSPDFPGRADVVVEVPSLIDGDPLSGRALLVVGEQGLGDEVMFATLLPDLIEALEPGGRLSLAVEPRLVPLFRRSFPGAQVSGHVTTKDISGVHRRLEPFGQVDAWAPLGALPPRFRNGVAAFPNHPAALTADADRVAFWRAALNAMSDKPKLGVTWRSGLLTGERRRAYAPLPLWREVFASPGVSFVNLQYDSTEAELAEIEASMGVRSWRPPGIDLRRDLDDLAALTCALDLVIGCANATTNIAAACGAPTWIVTGPSWWPMLGTEGLPWYPSARVFTAPAFDDWSPAMAQVAAALRLQFATR